MLSLSSSLQDNPSDKNAYRFDFVAIDGQPMPLKRFSGQVILVVNTASRCGFTRQYGDLQEVWDRFRDRGLLVLGVPSNDFGGQEPGSESEIKHFCTASFNVSFPMTAKVHVRGPDAHPFYRWAAKHLGPGSSPRWNFHKYLISSDGRLVQWFSTPTSPTSRNVLRAIEKELANIPPTPV
jgi:glutathione peroxidase